MTQVTREQLEVYTRDELYDGFSDCYKSLYDVRPRGEFTKEYLVNFWLTYEQNLKLAIEIEAYYEQQDAEREAQYEAQKKAVQQDREEMKTIGIYADKAYSMGVSLEELDGW